MDTQVEQIELAAIVLHGGTAPVVGVLKKETDKEITLGFAYGKDATAIIPKSNVVVYSKFLVGMDTPHLIAKMFIEFWGAHALELAPEAEEKTGMNAEQEAEQEAEPATE